MAKKKAAAPKLDANKALKKMSLPKRPPLNAKPETFSKYETKLKDVKAHNAKVDAETARRKTVK